MLIKVGVGFLGAMSALVMAVVLAVFQAGFCTVEIKTPETPEIYLPVPLAVVDLALAFVPEEELSEARRELERFRPLIEAAFAELRNCPDVTLVEVNKENERVVITKEGDDLLINVNKADREKVRIRVPVEGVHNTFAALMG